MRFDQADLAAGYASARPPVHTRVVAMAEERVGAPFTVDRALDVGCGAGASTVPLVERARHCVGVDPAREMIDALEARFRGGAVFGVVGAAEALPLSDRSVDLVSAAGSLEFADPERAVVEVARVLVPGGVVVAYDFTTGRPPADRPESSETVGTESTSIRCLGEIDWFGGDLLRRWPRPVGGAARGSDG